MNGSIVQRPSQTAPRERGELQQWLADRDRQRRTQQAIAGFAQQWRSGPVQARFDRGLAELPDASAESVAAAVERLLGDDDWLEALLEGLADHMRDDPFFEPPFPYLNGEMHSGLVLFEDPRVSIAAGVTHAAQLAARKTARRGATSVGFPGRMLVLKFIKAGGARISLWEAPWIAAGFTAADAGQCVRTGERRLADGDILILDGRYQSYVVEQVRSTMLIVQAEIAADQAPLSVEYDSAGHGFVGCSATDDSASRIQMIATLLRKLGCDAAFEPIAAFLDHPEFFVRWHVMKELLGIDAEAALPHLKRMAARDPHPDTRRAARTVLDRLQAPPQPQREAA
jgi:hypothetical protein